MKIKFEKANLRGMSSSLFLREAGYTPKRGESEASFVRRLGREDYPRFHIYIKEEGRELFFYLHLDQKRTSYKGHSAHSGEYDGPVVEEEAERLCSLF